LYVVTYTGCNA
jgi:hypothetical protein